MLREVRLDDTLDALPELPLLELLDDFLPLECPLEVDRLEPLDSEERPDSELVALERLPLLLLNEEFGELPDGRGKLPEEPDSLRCEELLEESNLLEAEGVAALLEEVALVELLDCPLRPDDEPRSELLSTLLLALREDSLEPEPLEPLALAERLEALEPALVVDSLPALRDEAFTDEPGEPLTPDDFPADAALPEEARVDDALGAEAADEPA